MSEPVERFYAEDVCTYPSPNGDLMRYADHERIVGQARVNVLTEVHETLMALSKSGLDTDRWVGVIKSLEAVESLSR